MRGAGNGTEVGAVSERQSTAQGLPDDSLNWQEFPRYRLVTGRTLYRAAKRGVGAWYFCNCGDCRFDLYSPRGTCYAGTDRVTGLLETIGPDWCAGEEAPVLIPELVEERQVHAYTLPEPRHLANLKTSRAVGFKITNELDTMTPYDVPRAYARCFDDSRGWRGRRRFRGIRYSTRFNTDYIPRGVALFDEEGERPWVSSAIYDVDTAFKAELRAVGIAVEEPPVMADLERADQGRNAA